MVLLMVATVFVQLLFKHSFDRESSVLSHVVTAWLNLV